MLWIGFHEFDNHCDDRLTIIGGSEMSELSQNNKENKTCCSANKQTAQQDTVASCCSVRKPEKPGSDSAAACCCVRKEEKKSPAQNGADYYEKFEPYLIGVSGLALLASFFHWLDGLLPFDPAWIAILVSGTPIFVKAFKSVFLFGRLSVSVLMTIAIFATILADRFFPHGAGHHSYLFAGGEVAFIMALGHWLEDWTVTKARAGIETLIRLTPQTARRIENGSERIVPAEEVQKQDVLRILPGETIPVDGTILSGTTSVDQSLMTGESMPVDKVAGESVFGGTINRFGSFTMQATRVGKDSSLAKMIQLVKEAEQKKAPMERIADRWATWLVPAALLTAILVGLISYAVLGQVEEAFRRAVTILVVFCPCSLVLATPTAIIAAIGNASHHGILIRSGETLEQFAKLDVMAFDKTGTLTVGQPQVNSIESFDSQYDSNGLLCLAASVETLSEHPLAASIVLAATERGAQLEQTSDFELFQGEGITAQLAGSMETAKVLAGNERLLERFGIEPDSFQKSRAGAHFEKGETVVWIAKQQQDAWKITGLLAIADAIRESSKSVIDNLQKEGIETILLTGDNERAAQNIAMQSGIRQVKPNLLPEGKVDAIQELSKNGFHVGMVGDGLNDAPALKTAQVGVAMGKVGSDLAIDAADVVLVGDDVSRLPFLVRLAKKTRQTIISNIGLSMGINAVAIVLASSGLIGPVLGALVHNAGSLFVVLNASLLLRVRR